MEGLQGYAIVWGLFMFQIIFAAFIVYKILTEINKKSDDTR